MLSIYNLFRIWQFQRNDFQCDWSISMQLILNKSSAEICNHSAKNGNGNNIYKHAT